MHTYMHGFGVPLFRGVGFDSDGSWLVICNAKGKGVLGGLIRVLDC